RARALRRKPARMGGSHQLADALRARRSSRELVERGTVGIDLGKNRDPILYGDRGPEALEDRTQTGQRRPLERLDRACRIPRHPAPCRCEMNARGQRRGGDARATLRGGVVDPSPEDARGDVCAATPSPLIPTMNSERAPEQPVAR